GDRTDFPRASGSSRAWHSSGQDPISFATFMPVQVLPVRVAQTRATEPPRRRLLIALDQVEQRLAFGPVLGDRGGEQPLALFRQAQKKDAAVGRRRLALEQVGF